MNNWDKRPPAGTRILTHKEIAQQRFPVAQRGIIHPPPSKSSAREPEPREEWEIHNKLDEKQRQTIYYNKRTGISTYQKPHCLKSAVERARDSEDGSAHSAKKMLEKVRAAEAEDKLDEEERYISGNMKRNEMSGYLDATAFQQASLDVAIGSENRGYRLLQKMGWKKGTGLGKNSNGLVTPLNPLGQQTEDIKRGAMGQQV